MKITTIGIDLAKEVFQIHGVDGRGKAVLRRQLKRSAMAVFLRAWSLARSAWKPAAARCQLRPAAGWMRIAYLWCTTGRGNLRGTAAPSN